MENTQKTVTKEVMKGPAKLCEIKVTRKGGKLKVWCKANLDTEFFAHKPKTPYKCKGKTFYYGRERVHPNWAVNTMLNETGSNAFQSDRPDLWLLMCEEAKDGYEIELPCPVVTLQGIRNSLTNLQAMIRDVYRDYLCPFEISMEVTSKIESNQD